MNRMVYVTCYYERVGYRISSCELGKKLISEIEWLHKKIACFCKSRLF